MTGFERRYGVLKRLGASPAPPLRSAARQGRRARGRRGRSRSSVIGGVGAGARVAPPDRRHRAGAAGGPRSATAAFAALGLLLAGVLRAEATLAAANLIYLLLLAGGGVVLPSSSYGAASGVVSVAALGCARRRRCGPPSSTAPSPGASSWCSCCAGRRSAPRSPRGRSDGSDDDRARRPGRPRLRRWAWATLVANIGIVVTGGAVRLTGLRARLPDLAALHRGVVHPARRAAASTRRSSSATGC